MNNERRRSAKHTALQIESMIVTLQCILDAEQLAYDCIPVSLRSASQAMASLAAQESLQAALRRLEDAICDLEAII